MWRLRLTPQVFDLPGLRQLNRAVCIGLSILLVVIGGGFLASRKPLTPATSQQAMPNDSSRSAGMLAQEVAEAHLFGRDAQAQEADHPMPTMDVRVDGLLYSTDAGSALAILTIDGKSKTFKVGDSLANGEKLVAIDPTSIELSAGGAPRKVELQQDYGDGRTGIMLAGDPDLIGGLRQTGGAPAAYKPRLQPATISTSQDPLDQLRSLRAQLIKH